MVHINGTNCDFILYNNVMYLAFLMQARLSPQMAESAKDRILWSVDFATVCHHVAASHVVFNWINVINPTYLLHLTKAPDYFKIIKQPMDFTTMRKKIDTFVYMNINEVEKDFDVMIENCMKYNGKDTVFYKAAVKLRDQVSWPDPLNISPYISKTIRRMNKLWLFGSNCIYCDF